MRDIFVVGVHTTKFGKYPASGIKMLAAEAIKGVLADAGLTRDVLESVWFSNSGWGMQKYQHCVRGQVALRPLGIESIPITNVENACAGGSTAFHGAWKDVMSGVCDVALAIGVEKTYQTNKYAVFASFLAGTDVEVAADEASRLLENMPEEAAAEPSLVSAHARVAGRPRSKPRPLSSRVRDLRDQAVVGIELGEAIGYDSLRKLLAVGKASKGKGNGKGGKGANRGDHSPFMDIYAHKAREHMRKYGSTARQLAVIAAKNHWHSSMNPNAQYTFVLTPEEVLADREVATPLTRAMCAPIGDGAAAAIVMSEEAVRRHGLGSRAVRIRASILGSGRTRGAEEPDIGERLAKIAFARAGLGPADIDCVELHDATAFGELHQTEALGFFPKGEGGLRAERGETRLGGALPVNPSGGLLSRGHPIGASGLAQIHELVTQLRGEARERQVQGARIALAENGGGAVGDEEAAMCIHVFERAPVATA
ncbi:MAG TPA: thiolase family protein [Polyangiaceae bacterium]|jgi:acetyl-CoA acetyltransferase|nr:thiolase family protein [Polyangiaceae bacterium]